MLCRIPEETAQKEPQYYGGRTREQMTAVDQDSDEGTTSFNADQ
jgi:hypothetical protein